MNFIIYEKSQKWKLEVLINLAYYFRSLQKTKKQMVQLDHEISRLQNLCYEMNVSRDELKQKLNRSASQRGQVIEYKEKLEQIVNFYRQKTTQISQWTSDLNQTQDKNISEIAKELSPVLLKGC